jgi:hypothetical protein
MVSRQKTWDLWGCRPALIGVGLQLTSAVPKDCFLLQGASPFEDSPGAVPAVGITSARYARGLRSVGVKLLGAENDEASACLA